MFRQYNKMMSIAQRNKESGQEKDSNYRQILAIEQE